MAADDHAPRSMRDEGVRERRKQMLKLPHVAPLTDYAEKLRGRPLVQVPDFDPLDGGIHARALFLFEKPGPMTAINGRRIGSGFVSRNNDDATAEATFRFMEQADLPRSLTVIWNVIPWWNKTVAVTKEELGEGVSCVGELLALLRPNLRAVVMVGRRAAAARPYLEKTKLKLFTSDHPSPRVRARWPSRWNAIPTEWVKVHNSL